MACASLDREITNLPHGSSASEPCPVKNYGQKIRVRRKEISPTVCRVADVDWSQQYQHRAGVIIYRSDECDSINFCIGRDTNYATYTDFGGGVKNTDETPLHAALRELEEETYGVFNYNVDDPKIDQSIVVLSDDFLVLFLEFEYDPKQVDNRYDQGKLLTRRQETDQLLHLSLRDFIVCVRENRPRMFFPTRELLNKCLDDLISLMFASKSNDIDPNFELT